VDQGLQVLGAILILTAYALAEFRVLDQKSYAYLLLNLVGSAILGVLAYQARQWGFVLLEASWAVVSAGSLVGRQRRRPNHPPQLPSWEWATRKLQSRWVADASSLRRELLVTDLVVHAPRTRWFVVVVRRPRPSRSRRP
jgi:hypothetical protein